jgi:hypothetical protein
MLERICALHEGSDACIPILRNVSVERAMDGRIRITGRVSPTNQIPNTVQPPANRRLVRESARKHFLSDISQRRSQTAPARASSSETSSSSEHPPSPKATPPPKEISIIPEEVNPARRFPTPVDTYSPGPSSPGLRSPVGLRSSRQGSPGTKPMIEFVYPPRPRPSRKDSNSAETSERGDSPGPNWLHKMLIDVQRGRKDLNSELEVMKREVNDAAGEVMRLQVLRAEEEKDMRAFLEYLRKVVGPNVVEEIIHGAQEAAEERTSDEDEDEGGDDDSESQNTDSISSKSPNENSDDDDDDGENDKDAGRGGRLYVHFFLCSFTLSLSASACSDGAPSDEPDHCQDLYIDGS